ncbi:MAG: lipopolysaccharide assembly outer membrane protein LptD (OstA), partial [Salibacteraceae bacterium]
MLTLFIYGLTPFVLNAYPSMTGVDLVITETHFTDSNSSVNSSNPIDTVQIDSVIDNIESPKKMESSFKSKVKYHANDSIMIDNKNNKAYLWGEAWVEYEDIKLDADYLEIDFAKNEVLAKGIADSTGEINNTPIFKEKGKEYKSGEMVYNFQTKKGLIKKITTQEANGYIHGQTIKMASQDVFYIKNGKYTTCSLDNPHYHIQAQKLKIINNDKIVTGPAYLVVENVPTFLAVPFGFFPNQDERTSGILIPAIGSSLTKGFNLTDGGYYLGISDQFDIKLLGDIYTNGSWSGRTIARYNSRYKRNGQLSVNYTVNNDGEKDTEDFTQRKSMFINWSHNQAPKAKPNSDFRAQVNIGSSDYFQNDLNTSSTNYIRNEFSSNITYSQRFGRSPFSASVNASHNQ